MLNSNNDKFYLESVKVNKLKLILGIFIFRVVLDFIYQKLIAPLFGHTGFNYIEDFGRYILSWLILLIFVPLIIKLHKKVSFSNVIMIFLVYLSLIPYTTMIAFYPYTINFIVQNAIYWMIMLVVYIVVPELNVVSIKKDPLVNFIVYAIILLFTAVIILISFRFTGLRITFDIYNVYVLRKEARTFAIPSIMSYIYYASESINPILVVYFLSNKKYSFTGLIFLTQILSFSINGSKTVLFSTVLTVFLYWIYNEEFIFKIPWILSLLGVSSVLEFYINKTFTIVNFIIRRVFFVPNLLNYYYFDFFTSHIPDYLKQSFLRFFGFKSSYPNIAYLIGNIYFNRPDMSANNGLISDAYANFGFLGLFIMPIIVVLFLKILDACAKGLDIRILIVSAITIAFIFISSFIFTILLTHGLIALCLILYLLPRQNINSKKVRLNIVKES